MRFFQSASDIDQLRAPWQNGSPSLYSFVAAAIEKRGSAQSELEVEIPIGDPKQIRWVAGALDSLFGAPDQSRAQIKARSVVAAINNVLRHPNEGNATHLYRLLSNDGTISIIDEVLPRVAEQLGDRRPQLAKLSRRLVRESPDVEPVKSGIALLGISGTPEDADLLFRMGHFEELTVYSVVALAHLLPEPEVQIWQLTKNVHGWGRIQAVHRLSATKNPEIKAWMLREGFKNRIMYEYLAYTCATAGELLEALSAPAPMMLCSMERATSSPPSSMAGRRRTSWTMVMVLLPASGICSIWRSGQRPTSILMLRRER